MFFPERITGIKPSDKVLEIGPGSMPHPRADVFLERKFEDTGTALAQSGYAEPAKLPGQVYYYDGKEFPFADNQFDYAICSHVIEHVPADELSTFVSEMQRVAKRGYIEFPNVIYELVNYQPVHIWFMYLRDDKMFFLHKDIFGSNNVHKIIRELFWSNDPYAAKLFTRHKDLFFNGYEWSKKIDYQIVSSYNELVTDEDFMNWQSYFKAFKEPVREEAPVVSGGIATRLLRKIYRKVTGAVRGVQAEMAARKHARNPKDYHVEATAQLHEKNLIEIGRNTEIKDYVVIRPNGNKIKIGQYVQLNYHTVIYGGSDVYIGDNVMIAPHCMIASGTHDYKQTDKPMRFVGHFSKGPIIIEDNVWIGANSTIADGVKIGQEAVVAANSLVNKDVEPWSIVGGVPAKVIGHRRKMES